MVDYIDFEKESKKQKKINKNIKYSGSYVLLIISINIITYLIQFIIPNFTQLFAMTPALFLQEPWRLFTYMFLHSKTNIFHIIFNMWVLLMFGSILESKIGKKKFLLIYILSGILAGIFSVFYYKFINANYILMLGASGAIQGIFGALIILMPNLRLMLLFPPIPMPLWIAGILFAIIDIFGLIIPNSTANFAHLIGLLTGILYGLYLKKNGTTNQKLFIKLK